MPSALSLGADYSPDDLHLLASKTKDNHQSRRPQSSEEAWLLPRQRSPTTSRQDDAIKEAFKKPLARLEQTF